MRDFSRRRVLGMAVLAGTTLGAGRLAVAAAGSWAKLQVFKSPWCGCCNDWIEHMQAACFRVTVEDLEDLAPVKAMLGVPPALESCHTGLIDGYVIEGHVPAQEVLRLLDERPTATGLAVPGMPIGSPGMEQGNQREPYDVVLFTPTAQSVFARY